MARPEKRDLFNASVAHSMKTWAKATIDLNLERERLTRSPPSIDDTIPNAPAASLELLKNS